MCTDCKNNCLETHVDKCLLYTGKDFDKLNIKSQQYYDVVIVNLLEELERICEEKVDLACIYTGDCDNCDREVSIPKAVQSIINKLCKLTSSDIEYEGEKYCIGDSSISRGAINLLGKPLKYSVQTSNSGTSISYDLTELTSELDTSYTVGRVNSTISGKNKRGKTLITDSDKQTVGVTVDNDRFPIYVDIDVRVGTSSGDVKLVKRLSIPHPTTGTYTAVMDVKDFGTELGEKFSLESFLEGVTAQVCKNKSELDALKNLDLIGCPNVEYSSTDIKDIISYHSSLICQLYKKIEGLENIPTNTKEPCDK